MAMTSCDTTLNLWLLEVSTSFRFRLCLSRPGPAASAVVGPTKGAASALAGVRGVATVPGSLGGIPDCHSESVLNVLLSSLSVSAVCLACASPGYSRLPCHSAFASNLQKCFRAFVTTTRHVACCTLAPMAHILPSMQCVRDRYPGLFQATTMQQFMWQDDIVGVAHFVHSTYCMPLSMLTLLLTPHLSSSEGGWNRCNLHSFICSAYSAHSSLDNHHVNTPIMQSECCTCCAMLQHAGLPQSRSSHSAVAIYSRVQYSARVSVPPGACRSTSAVQPQIVRTAPTYCGCLIPRLKGNPLCQDTFLPSFDP